MDLCLAVKNLVSNDVILKKCNSADDTQVFRKNNSKKTKRVCKTKNDFNFVYFVDLLQLM